MREDLRQNEAVNLGDGKRSGKSQAKQGPPRTGGSLGYLRCRSVLFQGPGQTLCVARALGKPKADETGPSLLKTLRLSAGVRVWGEGRGSVWEGLGPEGQHWVWKTIENFRFKCKSPMQM